MQRLHIAAVSVGVGIFAGIAATLFLYLLALVGSWRDAHGAIIWWLPAVGFAIGWLYHRYGREAVHGTDLVLQEVYTPQRRLPLRMAPMVLIGTLLTHLFGGSAGREGTSVQMAATLSDQWNRFLKFTELERRSLLIAGMGAGFGAAIGAPVAGIVFGIEVTRTTKWRWGVLLPSAFASVTAYAVTLLLGAPHTHYPSVIVPHLNWSVMTFVVFIGLVFGGITYLYVLMVHVFENWFRRIKYAPLRPVVGGALLVTLYHWEGSYQYVGLGIDSIQNALITPSYFLEPWLKLFFTALTLGSGFKGGEFIPLVFVGATLGSGIGVFFPAYFSLAAGLGFASVFGAASKTPLACSIMAIEIFGPAIAPYVITSCFIATYISGRRSIYRVQK